MTNDDHACDDEDGAFVTLDFLGDALDPATLLPVVPLAPNRSKRKGDPLGRPFNGRVPVAKTGYCSFSTGGMAGHGHGHGHGHGNGNGNDHVAFILRAIEPRIEDIRRVMAASGLRWKLMFFEGDAPGNRFADLEPELFAWAERLDLPLLREPEHTVTFIYSADQSEPDHA